MRKRCFYDFARVVGLLRSPVTERTAKTMLCDPAAVTKMLNHVVHRFTGNRFAGALIWKHEAAVRHVCALHERQKLDRDGCRRKAVIALPCENSRVAEARNQLAGELAQL